MGNSNSTARKSRHAVEEKVRMCSSGDEIIRVLASGEEILKIRAADEETVKIQTSSVEEEEAKTSSLPDSPSGSFSSAVEEQSGDESPSEESGSLDETQEMVSGTTPDPAQSPAELDLSSEDVSPPAEDVDTGDGGEDWKEKGPMQTSTKLKVFSSSEIKIDRKVGEGEFSCVYKAVLHGDSQLTVAVKEFPTFTSEVDDSHALSQLETITALKHQNVVSVLGLLAIPEVTDDNDDLYHDLGYTIGPRVLLQYFPEGSLLQYLTRLEDYLDYETTFKLALDIAQGCEYLHSQGIVHGNLAARNVLVEKQGPDSSPYITAKIADFGIIQLAPARGVEKNYVKVESGLIVPIRHVPLEIIHPNSKGFTFQSDVWSFGVTLWELLTGGATPYGKKKDEPMVELLIKDGLSPCDIRPPEGYSKSTTSILETIFKINPAERPSFADVTRLIDRELQIYSGASAYSYPRQSRGYSSRRRGRFRPSPRSTPSSPSTPPKLMDEDPLPGPSRQLGATGAPPPYTPRPLPNHSAMHRGGGSRSRGPPRQPRGPVNFDRAIEIKQQELEQLRVAKLQQEACQTWSKMQSLVSKLTNMTAGPGPSSSRQGGGGRRDRDRDRDRDHHRRDYDHSGPSGSSSRRDRHERAPRFSRGSDYTP